MEFRKELGRVLSYDFQPIPLLYTVVVCLTVRLYFIIALFGRQILYPKVFSTEEVVSFNLNIYV